MKTIKVVVGVLHNKNGQFLIAKRQNHQFMGEFWEFPGGKIEPGESAESAIKRELKEELNIDIKALSYHRTIFHTYPDRKIELNVYCINKYNNTPIGAEGQTIVWKKAHELKPYKLLPTMKTLITSIKLPNKYWITPSSNHQSKAWMKKFEEKLTKDIKLIQLRSKNKLDSGFIAEIYHECQQHNLKLLLNTIDKTFKESFCDGWHLTTNEMFEYTHRPCSENKLLGVSTHNIDEAMTAQKMGADFIVISPIQPTATHPNTKALGWENAKKVTNKITIPVYFLGGMTLKDLDKTLKFGAQGIAGVSAF